MCGALHVKQAWLVLASVRVSESVKNCGRKVYIYRRMQPSVA